MADSADPDLLILTAQITAAYVAGNTVEVASVPQIIRDVRLALVRTGTPAPAQIRQEPAVPIKRSIQPDHLVCLEDGAKVKMLTRYLKRFDLTPKAYRAKWGLPYDYPMVAPAHSAHRADVARKIGLGRRHRVSSPEHAPEDVSAPQPTTKARHTAASVFANFPSDKAPAEPAASTASTVKPARKRFGQQMIRPGGRRHRPRSS